MATFDVVLRGGMVFDGSGAPGVPADVALTADRISAVGVVTERGRTEIDARGMAVAPGFIDVHSHDDFAVLLGPTMPFKVMQGVTTDVVGNCGSGVVPYEAAVRRFGRIHPGATPPSWTGFEQYLARVQEAGPSLNVAVLMGHGSLRAGAMGLEQRAPTAEEMDRMRAWVREGVEAGAVGLSTGLIYEPGRYARTEEIITLARELGAGGGLYATHMRDEASGLLDSVHEAIRIGEEGGVPVQISHHKASGQSNWGKVRDSLRLIEAAQARGLDVHADQYPYTAGSTSLYAVVQNGALRRDSPGAVGSLSGDAVLIASAPKHPAYEGRRLGELAVEWGIDIEAAAARIIQEEGEACFVVLFSMDEADVRTVLAHPRPLRARRAGARPPHGDSQDDRVACGQVRFRGPRRRAVRSLRGSRRLRPSDHRRRRHLRRSLPLPRGHPRCLRQWHGGGPRRRAHGSPTRASPAARRGARVVTYPAELA